MEFIIFIASMTLAISLGILLLTHKYIKYKDALFVILISALTLSVGFEMLSKYPIGTDVHLEYYTIELLKSNLAKLGELGYYSDIVFFNFIYIIFGVVTGMQLINSMKFVGAFIIALIPLSIYLYVFFVTKDKFSAIVSSIAIMAQFSYVVTLHSTLKQALALFIVSILITSMLKFLKTRNAKYGVVYVILSLVLVGLHYTSSFIVAVLVFTSTLLYELLKGSDTVQDKISFPKRTLYIVSSVAVILGLHGTQFSRATF